MCPWIMSVYIKGTKRTFFWDILYDILIKFLKSSSITGFDRGSVQTFNFSSSEAVSSFFARKICGTARTGTRKYQVRKNYKNYHRIFCHCIFIFKDFWINRIWNINERLEDSINNQRFWKCCDREKVQWDTNRIKPRTETWNWIVF